MKGVDKAAPGAVQRTKLAYVSNAQLKPEELTELVGKIAVGAVDNLQVARACAPQPSSPAFQITACPPRLRFRMQVARAQQMAADRERVIHDEGFNTARAGDANDEPQRHRLLILTLPLRLAGAVADAAGGEEGAAGETGGRAGSGAKWQSKREVSDMRPVLPAGPSSSAARDGATSTAIAAVRVPTI